MQSHSAAGNLISVIEYAIAVTCTVFKYSVCNENLANVKARHCSLANVSEYLIVYTQILLHNRRVCNLRSLVS